VPPVTFDQPFLSVDPPHVGTSYSTRIQV